MRLSCVRIGLCLLLAGPLQGCTGNRAETSVPVASPPKADGAASGSHPPPDDVPDEPKIDARQNVGIPGPDVHPLRAEVFFSHWSARCLGPECMLCLPDDLINWRYYKKSARVTAPALVDRLWADYIAVKSSKNEMPSADCVDDARIMVVFHTTEPAARWFAAGQGCEGTSKAMMVTEGHWLHEKNGQVLRDMADAIGVAAQMQAQVADIFR